MRNESDDTGKETTEVAGSLPAGRLRCRLRSIAGKSSTCMEGFNILPASKEITVPTYLLVWQRSVADVCCIITRASFRSLLDLFHFGQLLLLLHTKQNMLALILPSIFRYSRWLNSEDLKTQ